MYTLNFSYQPNIFLTVLQLPGIGMSGGTVEEFLKKSLEKMGLDYVDLFLIHVPIGLKVNLINFLQVELANDSYSIFNNQQ